jgi:hypothetical protein
MAKIAFDSTHRTRPRASVVVSHLEDEYYLDKNKRLKTYPEKRDTQAYIDSFADTLFERILDSVLELPEEIRYNPSKEFVDATSRVKDKLELMLEADQVVSDIRAQYPELANASKAEIYAYVKERAEISYKNYLAEKAGKEEKIETKEDVKEGE